MSALAYALLMAAAMAWQTGWSLVLGFTLSGLVQAVIPRDRMRAQLGNGGIRAVALATAYGAASSSCSYAAAALSRTLFKKGAALAPALAFLFSSTNLVIELGVILWLLLGWQFTAAEWIGGIVLIAIMTVLVRFTASSELVAQARAHVEVGGGHEHANDVVPGANVWERLRNPQTRVIVAQNVAMDWSMLRSDILIGFFIAGAITTFVPSGVWHAVAMDGAPPATQLVVGAVAGAAVAIITFVCSIGNVPMAAVLWSAGFPFSGVLAFLYADLIVLPLLDVYRKYYGWRMAAYIFVIFFVTMVAAAMIMAIAFGQLHLTPPARPDLRTMVETFSFNYTFWLNALAAVAVIIFTIINRQNPMDHGHGDHSAHDDHDHHAHPIPAEL